MKKLKSKRELPSIGWREWVTLPDLKIPAIKAKVDTGARSSSLHAFNIDTYTRNKKDYVRFEVHPIQRSSRGSIEVKALVLEWRNVRSSSGIASLRPVIETSLEFAGESWPIELTLAGRDEMGFRMLLGREAIRRRFLVDAGRSYYGGKLHSPKKTKVRKVKR